MAKKKNLTRVYFNIVTERRVWNFYHFVSDYPPRWSCRGKNCCQFLWGGGGGGFVKAIKSFKYTSWQFASGWLISFYNETLSSKRKEN